MADLNYLTNKWPWLEFVDKGTVVEVSLGNNGYYNMKAGESFEEYVGLLDRYNSQRKYSAEIMDIYPYLYVAVIMDMIYVWCAVVVNGEKKAGTGIKNGEYPLKGYLEKDPAVIYSLAKDNADAWRASRPGWFYCSGHGKAEHSSAYGYHLYAGKYCKQFGLDNPKHFKMAMEEKYQ